MACPPERCNQRTSGSLVLVVGRQGRRKVFAFLEKPCTNVWRRHEAGFAPAREVMPMPRDEIVHRVTPRSWDKMSDEEDVPESAEVAGDSQAGSGSDEQPFRAVSSR